MTETPQRIDGYGNLVPDEAPPRRLTPTERAHEVILGLVGALTKRSTPPRDSITTSRNAKADVQFEIVTYPLEGEDDEAFAARAQARHDALEAKYPPSRAQNFGRDYLPNEKGGK